jgi:hypothetical protein
LILRRLGFRGDIAGKTGTSSDYRDAELELSRREEAIPQPDDPPPGPFSPADPGIAAVDWISVDENGYPVVQAKAGWGRSCRHCIAR